MGKPVIPRTRAVQDIQETVDFYFGEGAEKAAMGFVDALERAFRHLGSHPAGGSPRYAHESSIPGLRTWPVARYPHLIFFMERETRVDVWRVLHGQRDLPAWIAALP